MKMIPTRLGIATSALALLLAACGTATSTQPGSGSDNGIKGKSASDIQAAVIAAVTLKKTVEATGTGNLSGKTGAFDIKFDFIGKKAAGSIQSGGGTMTIELANDHFYATFDKTLAASFGGGPAAGALADKCIDFGSTSDPSNPLGTSSSGLNNLTPQQMFSDGPYTKGTVKQAQGVEVQPLISAKGDELDIATHGDPLPIQSTTKSDATTLTFKNWGSSFDVTVPAHCTSLTDLIGSLSGGTTTADPNATPSTDPNATATP